MMGAKDPRGLGKPGGHDRVPVMEDPMSESVPNPKPELGILLHLPGGVMWQMTGDSRGWADSFSHADPLARAVARSLLRTALDALDAP